MIRRLALIVLAYLIAAGAAALTLSVIGNLLIAVDERTPPADILFGALLDVEVWRNIAIGAALPGAAAIGFTVWRRSSRLPVHLALGAVVAMTTMAGYVYRTGATPDLEPLLIVTAAGLAAGLVYWALMRGVR